jgi:uncharacterized protein YdhG (YjbR/CyaY superfamily)
VVKPVATPKDIDAYIAGFPRDVQRLLKQMRIAIRKAAPKAEEATKYKIPTFVLNGNMVSFAAFKNHIGLYPAPRSHEAFTKELAAYDGSKSSVSFPLDKPIPIGLVGRIVKFRAKQLREKAAAKAKASR